VYVARWFSADSNYVHGLVRLFCAFRQEKTGLQRPIYSTAGVCRHPAYDNWVWCYVTSRNLIVSGSCVMNAQYINGVNQRMAVGYATAISSADRHVAIHLPEYGYAQSFAYAYDALSCPVSRKVEIVDH